MSRVQRNLDADTAPPNVEKLKASACDTGLSWAQASCDRHHETTVQSYSIRRAQSTAVQIRGGLRKAGWQMADAKKS